MSTTPDPIPSGDEPVDPAASMPSSEPASEPASEPSTEPSSSASTATAHDPDLKAVYAVAGATELAVGALRRTVGGGQRWASQRIADLRYRREALAKQAEELRHLGARQPGVSEPAPAASTYDDLAERGQRALRHLRVDVVERIDPAFDRIQARIDAARHALRTRALPETPPTDGAPAPVVVAEPAPVVVAEAVPVDPDPVPVDETVPVEPVLVEDDAVVDPPATPREP